MGKNEMVGAYIWFWWRNAKERDHIEDLAVDGRIILKGMGRRCMASDDPVQDRDRWRALVNAVMNLVQ